MVFSSGGPYRLKTVVIDAGHGGHDAGCLGASAKEKDVALAIALKLGQYIEETFPDVKVIYTRKTDVFIELMERAAIANKAKADLFISIHCNASPNKAAYGTETYAMGLHVSEANLNVAKRENSVILLEENYETNYDGFDPKSTEAYIIFSLYQNVNIDKSLSLASKIQTQFEERVKRFNRGVKQAGFIVLYKTNMPSILIETGFLSNPQEEKFLASDEGQVNVASAIFRAFREYKSEMEKEK
jgi:N-acetylmuramoyl-L-alanine amidase